MLAIRMQRTGRKGYASFRMVVQESSYSPKSGRVVANLGHYNPHTKESKIDTELAEKYLKNGAQPSPRVVRVLAAKKVAMPDWVEQPRVDRESKIRNPEKLRKNQPKAEVVQEESAPEPEVPAADSEKKPEQAAEVADDAKAEAVDKEDKEVTKET